MTDRWLRRAYSILEPQLGSRAVINRALAKETTFRVGGPAALFLVVETFDELTAVFKTIREYEPPWLVIGKGSNVLVSDAGFDGVVVRLGSDFQRVEVTGNKIRAGGGAMLSIIVQTALKHALGGLAFAIGIPGTVGGAVAGNAGAHGDSFGGLVRSATIFTPEGALKRVDREEITFRYRESSLAGQGIIAEVVLEMTPGDPELIAVDMDRFFRRRKESQPLNFPSAGSTFKNPPGDSAGRLIEAAGCKGLRIGGAQVSEKHANFVVNTGDASASDIHRLIFEVRGRVREASGVLLTPEIKMIGWFNEAPI